MQSPYYQYKEYLIEHYGEALYRVPIDFNQGCPNRRADGSGGCTFCNMRGSRAVQTLGKESVEEQMLEAIRFARDRYRAKKFMAYIQAFSATFGPDQRPLYEELLNTYPFDAVSIGTRPDCLRKEAYTFLEQLNRRVDIWVELGIQTTHDKTLTRINRGHDWAASEKAIQELHKHGIRVVAHVILGLPGETAREYQQTADRLAALPISAVKIHNLHIEKGTTLAQEQALHPISTLMEYEYAEYCMDFIRRMPPTIPILRLTTDTLDEELIAPKWQMAKGQFKEYMIQQMQCREWRQGDLYESGSRSTPLTNDDEALKPVSTGDGSTTFWNEAYKEHYHTPAGARLEAEQKYLAPGKLKERLQHGDVELLDICFGLGYNALAAINLAIREKGNLSVTALEMDRRVVGAAARHLRPDPTDLFDWNETLTELYETRHAQIDQQQITIHWGDARYTLSQLPTAHVDVVFLDAFSTQRNSELWTVDFFRAIRRVMKPDGLLLTYCAAIPVRSGLLSAGFHVGETEPVGRARGGTLAALQAEQITLPIPLHEQIMMRETTRGIPYSDPYGVWTNKEILRHRQEQILRQKASLNESV
jgi:uncharacterized protein